MTFVSNSLLIVNSGRSCVEEYTFTNLEPSVYMGECDVTGSLYDGHRLHHVRMTGTFGIAYDGWSIAYISDSHGLIALDVAHETATSFSTQLMSIRQLTFDPESNSLFGIHGDDIYQIDPGSQASVPYTVLAGNSPDAEVNCDFDTPRKLILYGADKYIVPDYKNNR